MSLSATQILALALDPSSTLRISSSLTGILNGIFDESANALRIKIQGYSLDNAVDPGVTDDLAGGFPVGSIWINTTADTSFISVDSTNGAAVWKDITVAAVAAGAAQLSWNFSTNTVKADPGSGNFRLNNAVPASASKIYIDDISKDGIDASSVFTGLSVGDKLLIKELGAASKNLLVTIIGVIDETGFFELSFSVDTSGTLFADTNACGFDFLYPDNTVFEKDHVVRNGAQWKTALDEAIALPKKFKHIFRVDRNITLVDADKSSGNVEGEIWFIVKTNFETTRPKIIDNKYSMNIKCSQLRWTGIDYLMDAADNGIFFTGDNNDVSTMYYFSNSDISRNANFPFLEIINDSYGGITLDRVTGTDTATSFGKIHLKQNSLGTEKAITELKVINGSNLSGILASADGTVGELNVYVSGGSVISNNGSGVWNATNGATINVIMTPDCQVSRDLVIGSSAVTFTVVGKAEDLSFFISDQDSDLTINTAITFVATKKRRILVSEIPTVTVKTAPTGSTATFDILVGGVSVFSTTISIDAGQKTSVTAATPAVLDATKTLINIGDLVELKILTVGTTIKGTGAKMNIPNLIEA